MYWRSCRGIPADDVEPARTPTVQVVTGPLHQADSAIAGPARLMNIEPIRCSGLLARWRMSLRLIVRPCGRSQSGYTHPGALKSLAATSPLD